MRTDSPVNFTLGITRMTNSKSYRAAIERNKIIIKLTIEEILTI